MTTQPKIPDGVANESLGVSLRKVETFTDGASAEPTALLLVPGLGIGMVIRNDAASVAAITDYTNYGVNAMEFTGASGWVNMSGITTADPAEGERIGLETDDVAFWRLVSMGCRISLLNPDEENDGYWDACQVTPQQLEQNWQLQEINNPTGSIFRNGLLPTKVLSNLVGANIANERSYETGLLRDLHKHVFRCKPCKDDHPFIKTVNSLILESTDALTYDATDEVFEFQRGSPTMQKLIDMLYDGSYHMVLIRLFGRGSSGSPPSRYHIDLHGNYEFIYDRDASESKFHTVGAHNKDFAAVRQRMRFSPAPSVIAP